MTLKCSTRAGVVALLLFALVGVACSDDGDERAEGANNSVGGDTDNNTPADAGQPPNNEPDAGSEEDEPVDMAAPPQATEVITADWLAGTLTVFSAEALAAAAAPEDAILRTIDLSDHPPGPLQLEITPDGKLAVVTASPGFFDGAAGILVGGPEVPEGGSLLLVDLDSGTVTATLDTADVPMGVAISPDGTTAYTANFGAEGARGRTMSIIDLSSGTITAEFNVGPGPEQVVLNDAGTLGLINIASRGGVKRFETQDPEGTLSALIETGSDPSDITFLPGSSRALVINSQSINAVLLDAGDASPERLASFTMPGIPYGADVIPGTDRVAAPVAGDPATLQILTVGEASVEGAETFELGGGPLAMNTAVDPSGDYAFVPHPASGSMSVVNLVTGDVHVVQWLDVTGPTYVALR